MQIFVDIAGAFKWMWIPFQSVDDTYIVINFVYKNFRRVDEEAQYCL